MTASVQEPIAPAELQILERVQQLAEAKATVPHGEIGRDSRRAAARVLEGTVTLEQPPKVAL